MAGRAVAAAGAALLLGLGGCATQTLASRVPQVHFVRLRTERAVLFGPYAWQYAHGGALQATLGAAAPRGTAHAAPRPPASPFSDSPVAFLIHGDFTRGEHVIVRVCLRADHSIASSNIVESSGDPHFDELAVAWAQRVRLRRQPADGRAVAPCGAVRVELHDSPEPAVIGGHTDGLG